MDPDETYISLTQAAAELPRRRGGRKTNVSTLYRWTTTGCRGVKLDFVQIGATRCTTREALKRFFDRLTIASAGNPVTVTPQNSASLRKAADQAERELDALGI